ncbi:hypothetical protein BSKO_00246 [Bryopsis sp. KO-2023]|nr:hypothetical protein BSKO_00246 [Bryopsis sp. KO-2023]
MQYRYLGNTGLKVSVLSFGAWVTFGTQIGLQEAKSLMTKYREAGVNFFDNAEIYNKGVAEKIMGDAIKELGWKRPEYVISTKLFWGGSTVNEVGLSRKHIIEGMKASLERLQLDYVDVVFCHRPDPFTPIEETVRAMNHVIEKGQAFYWGTSEWSAQQITEACEIAKNLKLIGPVVEQPEYHMFQRDRVEKEYLPVYKNYGTKLTTWSPLASGVLTGKYSGGTVPEGSRLAMSNFQGMREKKLVERRSQVDKVDQLKPIADELDCSLAQLALAWCAKNPNVATVITGATKMSQVEDNLGALGVIPKLTPDIIARIEAVIESAPEPESTFGR